MKKDWKKHNEELVRRGELFLSGWKGKVSNRNKGSMHEKVTSIKKLNKCLIAGYVGLLIDNCLERLLGCCNKLFGAYLYPISRKLNMANSMKNRSLGIIESYLFSTCWKYLIE